MTAAAGKWLYGSMFVLVLPALLVWWAIRLDGIGAVAWTQPLPRGLGLGMGAAGALLMAVSMHALWRHGGGLPMNAYPPPRFVARSTYAVLSHPIYAGFVLCVAGVAVAADSAAGLWVVTPAAALGAAMLVLGFEARALRARFGLPPNAPMLAVPPALPSDASRWRRVCAGLMVFAPWSGAYVLLSMMPAPQGAGELRLPFEYGFALQSWALWVYTLAYPFSALAPLALSSLAELRRFVIGGWLAAAIGFFLMLFVPGQAEFLPSGRTGAALWLETANRLADAEWLAMPSFHVVWAVIAAHCYASRRAGLAWPAFAMAAAIAVSSVLAGAHALVDVLAGAGCAHLCWNYERVWAAMLRLAERLANSWSAARFGRMRVISHAGWSALAMFCGSLLTLYLAGPGYAAEVLFVSLAGLAGAGIWGYALEGGHRLARPFGYFGGLLGVTLVLGILLLAEDAERVATLVASVAVGGAIAQALGRGRCLVQGCCHGSPTQGGHGIRVRNERSRVVALAGLGGKRIHATQLYSMLSNCAIAIVLLRLCTTGALATTVAGAYLVLASMARFAEEGYRGEPQTPRLAGLAIYQWLALGMTLCGVALSGVGGPRVHVAAELAAASVGISLVLGLVAAVALSVDFPESKKPLSRLTVIQESGDDRT